jgi:phage baseplate assembly protein V
MLRLVRKLVRRALFGTLTYFLFDDGYKTGGIESKLRNMIRFGTVVDGENTSGPQAKATWQDKGLNGVTSGMMQVLQKSTQGCKEFFLPRNGDQVVSLHDPDSPEVGFILGTLSSSSSPLTNDQNGPALVPQSLKSKATMFDDGVLIDYDPIASKLIISGPVKNVSISGITGPVSIQSSSTASLKFSQITIDSPVEFKQPVTMDQTVTMKSNLTVAGTTLLNGGGTATPNLVNADGSGDGS